MEQLIREAIDDGIVIHDNKSSTYICQICNKPMTSIISAGQHVANSKHIEACARAAIDSLQIAPNSLLRYLSSEIKAAVEEGIVRTTEISGGIPGYLCSVCKKPLTGLAPLRQHLQGTDHGKEIKKQQLSSVQHIVEGSNHWNQRPNGIESPLSKKLSNGLVSSTCSKSTNIATSPWSSFGNPSTFNRISAGAQTAASTQPQFLRRTVSQPAEPSQYHTGDHNTWKNAKNPSISICNQIPNMMASSHTSRTGNLADPIRTFKASDANQNFASTSSRPPTMTGAISKHSHAPITPNESTRSLQPQDDTRQLSNSQQPPSNQTPNVRVSTLRTAYSPLPMAITVAIPRQPSTELLQSELNRFSHQVDPKQTANVQNSQGGYSNGRQMPSETVSTHNQFLNITAFSESSRLQITPNISTVREHFTPISPEPMIMNGAIPQQLNTGLVPSESTRPLESQLDTRKHNPSTSSSTSPLVQQTLDDQVIIYNNEATGYECRVCSTPTPITRNTLIDHINAKGHIEEGSKYAIHYPNEAPRCLIDLLPEGAIEDAKAGTLIVIEGGSMKCMVCDKVFTGTAPLKQHLESFDHKRKITNNEGPHDTDVDEVTQAFNDGLVICMDNSSEKLRCEVCQITLNGRKNLADHLNGKKHKKVWEEAKKNTNIGPRGTEITTIPGYNNSSMYTSSQLSPSREPSIPSHNDEEDDPSLMPYSVKSSPRGHVHIFNYLFTGRVKSPKERNGAKQDSINILNTFNKMSYKVFIHEDLTAEATNHMLDDITRNRELNKIDSLVIFFLSHGKDSHTFSTSDLKELDLKTIWNKFTDTNCPAMKKKPKIIFANFCRGEHSEIPESDAVIDIPRDIVTIHATSEDITAPRSPLHGTHFVRALCEILNGDGKYLELRDIYIKLDFVVKSIKGRQPNWEDNRFRKFYFYRD